MATFSDYLRQEGMQQGMQANHADVWQAAEQAGERKAKIEDAREMLAAKLDIGLIKRIIKLTEDELESL